MSEHFIIIMNDKEELTNVPDYQKIRQTSQSAGGQGWNDDVETLVPSPVVRPPAGGTATTTTSPRQQGLMQAGVAQQPQQHLYGGNTSFSQEAWHGRSNPGGGGGGGTIKASWEAPPQSYNASKYEEDPSSPVYIPQGYTRPVTKYIDANGVERRFIRRTVSPNRRSFTEGLLTKAATSDLGSFSGATNLRNATSQKNLYQDFSPPPSTANTSEPGSRREHINYAEGRSESMASLGNFANMRTQHKAMGSSSFSGHFTSPGAGGDDQWKQIGGSHLAIKNHQEGLRHWQQQHQEELLHQHLETQALYESPSNQSMLMGGSDKNFTKLNIQDGPPARWEPVRRAADNIIREKNMIIDKLKNRILELEEDFKESESKLRQALISKEDDADLVKDKLQELQHANATMKERLNEERGKKNSEIDDLELKLGSAEHEIQKLKEALRNKSTEASDVHEQFLEKSREADAWHDKFKESCEGHQDMKKKLDSLQRYLDELPTVEESQIQAHQILSLREENVALKSRCEGLDKKLSQVRKVITARDFRIRELEERERDLEHKLEEANYEVERLRDTEGSEIYNTQRELDHCKSDKERMAIDLEKAKKLLETTHLKLRQAEVKYQGEMKAIQERLTQEEETVVSLRNEAAEKESQFAKMRRSMKELGAQNQEQLEQTLLLKQQLRHAEQHSPRLRQQQYMDDASSGSSGYSTSSTGPSTTGQQRRLMQQLGLCFSELQALVNVCSQTAKGEDPDISVLLGVKNPGQAEEATGGDSEQSDSDGNQAKTLSQWLGKLGELRREVDKLRAHICNKYAEDMGDNITCATQ